MNKQIWSHVSGTVWMGCWCSDGILMLRWDADAPMGCWCSDGMLMRPEAFHSLAASYHPNAEFKPPTLHWLSGRKYPTSIPGSSHSLAPEKQKEAEQDLLLATIPKLKSWGMKILAWSLVRFKFSGLLEYNCLRLGVLCRPFWFIQMVHIQTQVLLAYLSCAHLQKSL